MAKFHKTILNYHSFICVMVIIFKLIEKLFRIYNSISNKTKTEPITKDKFRIKFKYVQESAAYGY